MTTTNDPQRIQLIAVDSDGPQHVDDFRLGAREIIVDIYGYAPDEVLFIDDVDRVAEVTTTLGAGFIGVPANMAHNFQKAEMDATGGRS